MQKFGLFIALILFASACTHAPTQRGSETGQPTTPNEEAQVEVPPSTRFAQAQVAAAGAPVQGRVSFEQMPNSTIATYRLDGVTSQKYYQFSVLPAGACESVTSHTGKNPGQVVHTFKVINKGFSESSFRTDKFSVAGKDSLIGQSIAVALIGNKKENPVQAMVACAPIVAATAEEIHPVTPESETQP